MRPGNRTGDVSAAIQQYVESRGFYVTREYTGHGVGRDMLSKEKSTHESSTFHP
jgi:methionyl aminopeptidase